MAQDNKLKTFNELLYENEAKWADQVYLRQPINGVWHEVTWKEAMLRARKVTTFLKSLGLQKGDKVAILSKNCAEWFMADFAIAIGGFISVPLFATQHKDSIAYILDHSEAKVIFVGKLDDWQAQEPGIPKHIPRISFPYDNAMPALYKWEAILAGFEPDMENHIPKMDDLYTIIYTSGTTGKPKGAMIPFSALSHLHVLHEKENIFTKFDHHKLISYLPLGHIMERIGIELTSLYFKSTVSFVENLASFAKNLQEISPTIFQAVPRLWTQFQKVILSKIPQHKLDILLSIPLIGFLIKKKLLKSLGLKNAAWIVSGSAPLPPQLLEWYKKIGVNIAEGYGRTEDLAITVFNRYDHIVMGSVGKPRPGAELKISDEGEVLIKSKAIMSGYYKDPETTKSVFTEDGYLRSGDKGRLDEDGNLYIIGRINDAFKTDKGEFVAPVPIEDQFMANQNIEQVCLIGLTLPQPVLLVVLSEAAKKMDRSTVTESLKETLESINPGLTKFEKVSHIIIAKEGWTPENALLTPTLKMKRSAIHTKYIDLAHKTILSPDPIAWE